jgi:TolA-binding protein
MKHCREQAEAFLVQKSREFVRAARQAAERVLTTLAAAASGLAPLEGRKTVVFVTDGLFADEYTAQLRQIAGTAGRAGVTIYAIDGRGLDRSDKMGRSLLDVEGAPPGLAVEAFDTRDDPADQLAADTGGLVVRNVNDGAKALATIARDTSSYYVIGYTPADTTWDGRFRRIEVRVKRDGLSVRARRGYFAQPRSAPLIAGAPQPAPPAPLTANSVVPSALSPVAALAPARPSATDRVRELIELSAGATSATGAGGAPGASGAPDATRASPASTNDAAQRGWAHYERGDLEGAARELREATAQGGAPVWASYALGQAEFGLRRFTEAIAAWRRVRDAVPEFEPVYFDLVDAHLQAADPREAIAVLRDAERRWPRDPEVHNALGVVQVGRGALDDSIESFKKAIAAAPDAALAYFNLGRALEMRYARTRRWMPATAGWVGNAADRRAAVVSYQKYLELGGPFEQSAREGLARLEWQQ